MTKNNIKKILLLLTLTILLLGITHAEEVKDNTTTQETIKDTTNTDITESNIEDTNKEINKQEKIDKTTKSTSETYEVDDFTSLHEALTSTYYETITVNLKSDITIEDNTRLNNAIKNININGNQKTINGNDKYQFLIIGNANVTLKDIKITNCYSDYDGGAIENYGKLIIKNSILNDNNARVDGGAIYSLNANLTLYNCSFNNNHANSGGTIYNYASNLTITNSIFDNNNAGEGGLIYNKESLVTLTASTLNNNTAKYGSCIYNDEGVLTIINSTLNNNYASNSGCIYNEENSNLNITNTILNYNEAKYGGAITNFGTSTIQNSIFNNNQAIEGAAIYGANKVNNCTFTNNHADSNGGSIYIEQNYALIEKNVFYNNSAEYGSAIYSNIPRILEGPSEIVEFYKTAKLGYSIINNNTFKENKANQNGNSIINNGFNNTIENNKNDITSKDSSTIYISLNESNHKITNNIFDDGRTNTIIKINTIENTKFGENTTITGKAITAKNVNLKGATLNIEISGVKYTTKTDNKGEFTLTIQSKTLGTNKVTVTFPGNTNYAESTATTTFTVKMPTQILLNSIKTTEYSDEAKIKGTYKTITGVLLKKTTMTILVNGVKYTTKTDSKGIFILYAPTKAVGTNNVTVSYAGNTKYEGATNTTTFQVVPKSTIIILNSIKDTKYTDNAKIKGTYKTTSDVLLKKTTVTILVNGVKYTTKTDSKGIFILYVQAKNMGKNNVTVSYAGNTKYQGATNKTTFNVIKQDLKIGLDKIGSVKKGINVTIKGTFTDVNGVTIKSTTLKVKVNNVVYNSKTDSKGVFVLSVPTSVAGTYNVTVSYAGNVRYNSISNSTYFVVN